MPVERLTRDTQLGAQLAHLRVGLAHGGLRQAELGGRHFERTPPVAASGAG